MDGGAIVTHAKIRESGVTVCGSIVRAGDVFDVMRRYQGTRGTWFLALGRDGRVHLPMVDEKKVEEVE